MDVLLDDDEKFIQEAVRHYFDAECDTDRVRLIEDGDELLDTCLLYTSPSPRDQRGSRMPSSA